MNHWTLSPTDISGVLHLVLFTEHVRANLFPVWGEHTLYGRSSVHHPPNRCGSSKDLRMVASEEPSRPSRFEGLAVPVHLTSQQIRSDPQA